MVQQFIGDIEMKKTLLIILPLLLIVGSSKVEGQQQLIPFVEKNKNGNLEITYYKETQNKLEKVKYKEYYPNGQKSSEYTYKDGDRDGKYTYWSKDGQKSSEGTYKNGKQVGKWTTWYSIGQKWSEVTYKNGKQDGKYTQWYPNGQKSSEYTYKDGKQDGLWTTWDEDGQKRSETTYKDDEWISRKDWNEDGSVRE